MKKLIAVLFLFVTSTAMSEYNYGYNYNYNNNDNSAYEGSSGARYQYDLSDPSDRIDYGVDLDAQMRDQLSVDPYRSLDQGMGQYGGGIYD